MTCTSVYNTANKVYDAIRGSLNYIHSDKKGGDTFNPLRKNVECN